MSALTLRDLYTGGLLAEEDYRTALQYVYSTRPCDLTIAPDGRPYLYRWHAARRNRKANVYLHVQVADDPERPLHDHPWDNVSVILAGGYDELLVRDPEHADALYQQRRAPGDVIFRRATEAHRLFLPAGVPYTMTLFTTGPTVRDWGFWLEHPHRRWVSHKECIQNTEDGRSLWVGPV